MPPQNRHPMTLGVNLSKQWKGENVAFSKKRHKGVSTAIGKRCRTEERGKAIQKKGTEKLLLKAKILRTIGTG